MRPHFAPLVLLAFTLTASVARADVLVGTERVPVVDMHLHPGHYANMATAGRRFVSESIPPFAQAYAPALIETLLSPYGEHVGIRSQCQMAGVDHAVLFGVYAPRSTGFYSNEELASVLTDPANVAADGRPFAWGMASIDFEDFLDPGVAQARYAALESYFVARRDLFIGIKLAHAHQAVTLDDARYLGVYDIAARHHVPVLLHTGFSPFPGTQTDPAYYDPQGLEAVVTAYDGAHGMGRVDFVLSHVGQGDRRAVEHALGLATAHDNVWLEISALNRPFLIGDSGETLMSTTPQYPEVLHQLRARGLVGRTLFATDGPQFSGLVRSYLNRMVEAMQTDGYSTAEIRQVLSGNFESLYL